VIEVELTPKTPSRLERIVRGWSIAVMAGDVAGVRYRCAPGRTLRAVRRAVEKIGAADRVDVEELSE